MTDAAPPPPPDQRLGSVRLHVQGSRVARLVTPSVWFNGRPVPVRFGQNDVPVHPGRVNVHASTQWLREYGQADLGVDVAPGATVEVWYAAPQHQFTTGSIGLEKQRPKGTAVLVLVVLVVVLLALAYVLATG